MIQIKLKKVYVHKNIQTNKKQNKNKKFLVDSEKNLKIIKVTRT